MALKIIGQLRPSSGIGTYEEVGSPTLGQARVISTLVLCNTDASNADSFIVAVKKGAGAPTAANIIYRGTLPPTESFVATNGITLEEDAHLWVATASGYVTVTAFGDES